MGSYNALLQLIFLLKWVHDTYKMTKQNHKSLKIRKIKDSSPICFYTYNFTFRSSLQSTRKDVSNLSWRLLECYIARRVRCGINLRFLVNLVSLSTGNNQLGPLFNRHCLRIIPILENRNPHNPRRSRFCRLHSSRFGWGVLFI